MKRNHEVQLNDFFKENESRLLEIYPGLSLSYFIEEMMKIESDIDLKESLLEKKIPLAYLTKKRFFYKWDFFVSEKTLIPRFETEILVEKSVDYLMSLEKEKVVFLDMGTGSGNIALSLLMDLQQKTNKKIICYLTDVSVDALDVAKKNYHYFVEKKMIKEGHEVFFIKHDALRQLSLENPLDLVVTNPPYIKRHADRKSVHETVLLHEPSLALFLEDENYDNWFQQLFSDFCLLVEDQKEAVMFLMEGHEDHLEGLQEMAVREKMKSVEVIQDFTQRNRFLQFFSKERRKTIDG